MGMHEKQFNHWGDIKSNGGEKTIIGVMGRVCPDNSNNEGEVCNNSHQVGGGFQNMFQPTNFSVLSSRECPQS